MAPKLVTTPCDPLTYRIIGCAMAVHRKLGPGYREDTYQRDLEVHFPPNDVAAHRVNRHWLFVPDWIRDE